jgi:hypothetical protein
MSLATLQSTYHEGLIDSPLNYHVFMEYMRAFLLIITFSMTKVVVVSKVSDQILMEVCHGPHQLETLY